MNRKRYAAAMAILACAATWAAAPVRTWVLKSGETELRESSVGELEVGMAVRLARPEAVEVPADGGRGFSPVQGVGQRGTIVRFLRRESGRHAMDFAVVRWDEQRWDGAGVLPAFEAPAPVESLGLAARI